MDERNRPIDREEQPEDLETPKAETQCGLSKEDVDVVAGGRAPIHTPPQ